MKMGKILIVTAIIAIGLAAKAQTLVLSDSFDSGGVATSDLNYNQDARQAGTAKPIGFNRTPHPVYAPDAVYGLTATGKLLIQGGGDSGYHADDYVVTDDFGPEIGSDSFSIKWKGQQMQDDGVNNATLLCIQCDSIEEDNYMYDVSPISIIIWDDENNIDFQFGTTQNNRHNGNNLYIRLTSELINNAIGGTYDANNEHEFEIRAYAQSATNGTWGFYLDGVHLISGLPYVFDDAVKKLNWQPHPSTSNEYNFDDLEISTIIPPAESEYAFFDDFNADNYPDGNWGYHTRQTNGTVVLPYGPVPFGNFSITNNKLHAYTYAAELKEEASLDNRIVGKDFELSCKVTVLATDANWSSFYLYDDTGNRRGDSRLGCLIWGQGHGHAFTLYAGVTVPENPVPGGITVDQMTAALGYTYDKSVEHTLQFISTAGIDETNTYDFVVDGVTIASNIVYRFDGATRHVGIIGVNDTDITKGVFYDDVYVRVLPELTYATWAQENGLVGADTNRTADIENGGIGDGVENLLEYVLGGDPNLDDAASILPVAGYVLDELEYVYNRRVDALARDLTYDVVINTNGLQSSWENVGSSLETGSGAIDSEFESVTNALPITGIDAGFINLEVTEN